MMQKRPDTIEHLQPGIRKVLASNSSSMTYWGTNTYIVGEGSVAIIDPGPADPHHLLNILSALKFGETVAAIFVTHSHLDHSALARPLAQKTGAPIIAFGDSQAGRSAVMDELVQANPDMRGRGVDTVFIPDETINDGQKFAGFDWALTAIHTPGHFGNHTCFAWNDVVFTGDHIMDWASTMVAPPDGDLAAFMTSLKIFETRNDRVFYPGHGQMVTEPADRVHWITQHRISRKNEILERLAQSPANIVEIAKNIYPDISEPLRTAAQATIFAHLIDLVQKTLVCAQPFLSLDAIFRLRNN